ncbi:MAG: ESX secretion-associated protein EspG [Rhodococcus sp.]|nr:ESX secretion-associated protein EspG [Rhodococcus sp. (in: high G+C Gram-positive bacteria)]
MTRRAITGRRWSFTAHEFAWLWEDQIKRDRLPYPLMYRNTAPTLDAYRAQCDSVRESVQSKLGEQLLRALQVLAQPRIRIEVSGFRDMARNNVRVRAHAGIVDKLGVVVTQEPGPTDQIGGDIFVYAGPPTIVPTLIAGCLPPRNPGQLKGVRLHSSEIAHDKDRSFLQSAGISSPREQYRAFFDRERDGLGRIEVFVGPAFDWRPTSDGMHVSWMDYVGDGRYMVRREDEIRAIAADPAKITAGVRQLIARAEAGVIVR